MTTFDKCINKALSERARNKVNFKVRKGKNFGGVTFGPHKIRWGVGVICGGCLVGWVGHSKPLTFFPIQCSILTTHTILGVEVDSKYFFKFRSTWGGNILKKFFWKKFLKAEKLRAYRFCDNVWTFMMENVEFRDAQRPIEGSIDRVKFVACKLLENLSGIYSKNPRFWS